MKNSSQQNIFFPFLVVCLLIFCRDSWSAENAQESTSSIEPVVGHLLPAEGGSGNTKSPLNYPLGVDFDSDGNMVIVELTGSRVHRLNKNGRLEIIAGDGSKGYSGDGGPARAATFNDMHNLAIDRDDNILIADSSNCCIRRIDRSGKIETISGNGEQGFDGEKGPLKDARYRKIMCISFDPQKANLFVADIYNYRVRSIDMESQQIHTVAGTGAQGVPENGQKAAQSPLVDPRAVAADSVGNVYILERSGNALRVVDKHGNIRTVAGTGEKGFVDGAGTQAKFSGPKHLCVDNEDNVYIADDKNNAIRKYDSGTGMVTTVLGRGQGNITLSGPHGVCFHDGKLYVVDSGNNRILSWNADEKE